MKKLFLTFVLLAPVFSMAMSCKDVPSDRNFKLTEEYRLEIQRFFKSHLLDLEEKRKIMETKFLDEVIFKENATAGGSMNIGGIQMNFSNLGRTPQLLRSTLEALNLAYTIRADGPRLSNEEYNEARRQAKSAVIADPYFKWLVQNRVDSRVQKIQEGAFTSAREGLKPIEVSVDPVELLFSTLEVSGPARLSPLQSLIRVMRDLDPNISPDQHKLAVELLELAKFEKVFRIYDDWQSPRESAAGAWDYAPDLVTAKKKLTELREQVVRDLGDKFPRKSYIRALRLIAEGDPRIKVFGQMLEKRWKLNLSEIKGEHIQEFLPRLQELHKTLELPSLFRLEEMADVFYRLHNFTPVPDAKHNSNYADFLMSVYMAHHVVIVGQRVNTMNEAASNLRYKIEKLKSIIELGEAATSDQAFILYLLKLKSRLNFYH